MFLIMMTKYRTKNTSNQNWAPHEDFPIRKVCIVWRRQGPVHMTGYLSWQIDTSATTVFRAFSQGFNCDSGTLNPLSLSIGKADTLDLATMRTINYSEVTDRASLVAQIVKNSPAAQETQVSPCTGMIPWRREWQPTLAFLPGEFHWQRNLVGYSPWGLKQSDTTEP